MKYAPKDTDIKLLHAYFEGSTSESEDKMIERNIQTNEEFRQKAIYYQTYFNLIKGAEANIDLHLVEYPANNSFFYTPKFWVIGAISLFICLTIFFWIQYNGTIKQPKIIEKKLTEAKGRKENIQKEIKEPTTKFIKSTLPNLTCLHEQINALYITYQDTDSLGIVGKVSDVDTDRVASIKALPTLLARLNTLKQTTLPTPVYDTLRVGDTLQLAYQQAYLIDNHNAHTKIAFEIQAIQLLIDEQYFGKGSRGSENTTPQPKSMPTLALQATEAEINKHYNLFPNYCSTIATQTQELAEQKRRMWRTLVKLTFR